MTKLIYLSLVLTTACVTATAPAPIPRLSACLTQASLWCDRAGYPDSPGCRVWYQHECMPSGPSGDVEADEQAECLTAIESNPTPGVEPQACIVTWY